MEPGICPVCKKELIDYDTAEPSGNYIIYPWHCSHCNHKGQEIYELNFIGHENVEEEEEEK